LNNDGTPKKYAKTAQYRIQVLLNEIDDQAWNKARQENTVAAYQTYLNGNTLKKHAGKAQKQLKEYQKQLEEAEKHLEDEEAWQWTRQQNTKAAYQAYLDGDTLKKYAENAKNALQDDRYIDNDDGAVTDTRTGLVWLKNANCLNRQNLETAMQSAAELAHGQCGLSDGSKAGDWRLPTKDEWEMMLDDKRSKEPVLSNAAGTDKWIEGEVFSDVQTHFYWSSTEYSIGRSWFVLLYDGFVGFDRLTKVFHVWPVRSEKIGL
jgi:hypothetical protein